MVYCRGYLSGYYPAGINRQGVMRWPRWSELAGLGTSLNCHPRGVQIVHAAQVIQLMSHVNAQLVMFWIFFWILFELL